MGNEGDQGYRGALDGAYARIAELEQQLAAARTQQPRIEQLAVAHAAARRALATETARLRRTALTTLGLGAMGTVLAVPVVACLGVAEHPINICVLGLFVAMVGSVVVAQRASRERVHLDRKVRRLADEIDALASQTTGVRVDERVELLDAARDAEPVAAPGGGARNTR